MTNARNSWNLSGDLINECGMKEWQPIREGLATKRGVLDARQRLGVRRCAPLCVVGPGHPTRGQGCPRSCGATGGP